VDSANKKKLRTQAHALKPVIIIGQAGYTAAVLAEIDLALDSHELIKIRIRAEREDRTYISEKVCNDTGAQLIQTIGQITVIYRQNPDK
jgi:RNA-binding protein